MGILKIFDYLKILASNSRQINVLNVNQPQQLAYGLGHVPPTLIARSTALGDPDLSPELFLVHSELAPDVTGIQDSIKQFHRHSVIKRILSHEAQCACRTQQNTR